MDFNIKLSNRQILRGIIKSPGSDLKIVIIMVHGLGEHINRYSDLADRFILNKIGFAGVDLPGHGHSEGKRGHIRSYNLLDEMTGILVSECRKTFPGIPLFLYGQSLGGTIVLHYLLNRNPEVAGAIVTSPWLKLSFEPDRNKVKLAAIVQHIMPGLLQPSGLVAEHLAHDKEIVEKYKTDPDNHGKISVRLFIKTERAASELLQNASSLKIPLLLMHGSDDQICSPEGSREFASKTGKAELKIWDGGFHELHNEPFREEVFNYVLKWIYSRIKD
jgi:alpha-beta hydrolase superfamily lysophospholipase